MWCLVQLRSTYVDQDGLIVTNILKPAVQMCSVRTMKFLNGLDSTPHKGTMWVLASMQVNARNAMELYRMKELGTSFSP